MQACGSCGVGILLYLCRVKKRYRELKILNFEDTEILSRAAVKPFVTVGMFDGVHAGHRCLLEDLCRRAKAAEAESVVVSFLSHPRAVLGTVEGGFGLLQTNKRRFERIAYCGVDWLLPLAFTRELAMMRASAFMDMLIEKLNPQEVLLGYDNRFGKKGDSSFDEIIACGEYRGVRVERSKGRVFCEGVEVSSTRIRKALQQGRVDLAAEMLEEPYSVIGIVEEGRIVSVDKGEWDKACLLESVDDFNRKWLSACRDKLKESGTIWICGTYHNIFSIGKLLEETGFRILNVVTWVKTNPPPNLSCRFFTHSTEFIIWARKHKKVPHFYNYELLRKIAGGRQMKDVWELPAISVWEKSCGKHPTQKPLSVLTRAVLASTHVGSWILDPFAGSSTTGIAANLTGRRYLGIEQEKDASIGKKIRRVGKYHIEFEVKHRKKFHTIPLQ